MYISNQEESRGCIVLGEVRDRDGRPCTARMTVAVVDDRPVALIFPATRRVVLDRLRKLLGADEVRLAPCDAVKRIFGDPKAVLRSGSVPDPGGLAVLMDASLLSARTLEIQSNGEARPIRLTVEGWLATANPGLGFFAEPDRGSN
jgi:hypothetical protein